MNHSHRIGRRDFLKGGALGGLGLAGMFEWPLSFAADGPCRRFRSIEVFLEGGASHIDLWDPKPDAPAEIRGAFSSISTAVPGMFISELLPKTAQIADWLTIVRGATHRQTDHGPAARVVLAGQPSPQIEESSAIEIAGSTLGDSLPEALRLVESGNRFVRVRSGHWDTHRRNAWCLKEILAPDFDQSFAALITDLADRCLLESTQVMVTTEFGRSPRINRLAGRDHWPSAFSIVIAGGASGACHVIGGTDRFGASVTDDPLEFRLRPALVEVNSDRASPGGHMRRRTG